MEASKFLGLTCVDAPSVQEPQHHSFLLPFYRRNILYLDKCRLSPLEREHISTYQFVALLGKELLLGSKSSRMVKLSMSM